VNGITSREATCYASPMSRGLWLERSAAATLGAGAPAGTNISPPSSAESSCPISREPLREGGW